MFNVFGFSIILTTQEHGIINITYINDDVKGKKIMGQTTAYTVYKSDSPLCY